MATPTLQRDRNVLYISPLLMSSSVNPLMQQQIVAIHFLPRIASLLNGVKPRNLQSIDERKRKTVAMKREDVKRDGPVDEGSRIQRPPSAAKGDWNHHSPLPVALSINVPDRDAVYRTDVASCSSPLDVRSQEHPTPIETSSRYISQVPLDSPSYRLSHDPAGRRRLFYHHSIDPLEIHISTDTPGASHIYHQRLSRKYRNSGRFCHQLSSSQTHAGFSSRQEAPEIDMSVQKRRRVVAPTSVLRPPHYKPEYGLTVFETSKSPMDSRYVPSIEHFTEGCVSTLRRRYIRSNLSDMEKYDSPVTVSSRVICSENEGVLKTIAFASKTKTLGRARCKQHNVENRASFPVTTLVLQSPKELIKFNSIVRNCHDEVDSVATFLNVGFESSSIYALLCPLRKGRWKPEEDSYTMGLLRLIENGTILLHLGQSIRGYIGEKLYSDDMRVLKKLSNCKMFCFVKLINPRLAEEEKVDMSVALVAVRKHLNDSSLRDLVNTHA
ncbi:unnamed protein product [Peronospora destructor]|uniref:Uncharacterized protein n=1 Tax=Peronospora destructor TaxID=86335 RepID=A0AAV0U3W7_9STRA|nr:unnamed protein product [Peronospora destructor]